jgi:hypothetical protein
MGLKTDFVWHEEILFAECRVVVKPSDATSCRKVFVISPRLKGDPLDVHRLSHFEKWDSAEKRWLSSSSSLLCPGTRTTFQCPRKGYGYPDGAIVEGARCVEGLWQ